MHSHTTPGRATRVLRAVADSPNKHWRFVLRMVPALIASSVPKLESWNRGAGNGNDHIVPRSEVRPGPSRSIYDPVRLTGLEECYHPRPPVDTRNAMARKRPAIRPRTDASMNLCMYPGRIPAAMCEGRFMRLIQGEEPTNARYQTNRHQDLKNLSLVISGVVGAARPHLSRGWLRRPRETEPSPRSRAQPHYNRGERGGQADDGCLGQSIIQAASHSVTCSC